jgi:protein-disulfide isomerase
MKANGEVKLFAGILVFALLLTGIVVYPMLGKSKEDPEKGPRPAPELKMEMAVAPTSHTKGDPSAPYTLVEFADFQCPSCQKASQEADKRLEANKGKLKLVYRHTRVAQAHQHSELLAQASEIAAKQGKFWEMHDLLFKGQDKFNHYDGLNDEEVLNVVVKFAKDLGMDGDKFKADMQAGVGKEIVAADQKTGIETLHMNSTPTFYFFPPSGKAKTFVGWTEMTKFLDDPKGWDAP